MKIIDLFNRLPLTGRYGMCEVLVEYMNDNNLIDHNVVCLDDLLNYIDKTYLNFLKESKFSEYDVVKDLTNGEMRYTPEKSKLKSKVSTVSIHILDPKFKKTPNQNAQLNYYTKSKKIIDPNGFFIFELVFKNSKFKFCFSEKNGKSNSKYVIFPELSSLDEHIDYYRNIYNYIDTNNGDFMVWTKGASGLIKKHYNDGNWLNTNSTHSIISKLYHLEVLINANNFNDKRWFVMSESGKYDEFVIKNKWIKISNENNFDLLKYINSLLNHSKNSDNVYIYDLNEQSESIRIILNSSESSILKKIVDHVMKYKIVFKEENKLVTYIINKHKMETHKGKEIGEQMSSFSYKVAKKRVIKEKENPTLEDRKIINKKCDSYKSELVNILNKSKNYKELIKNVESFTLKHEDKCTNSFLMTKFFELDNWNTLSDEQYDNLVVGIRCGLYLKPVKNISENAEIITENEHENENENEFDDIYE